MISIQGRVDISAERTLVFQEFSRIESWPEWWTDCRGAELVPGWQHGAFINISLIPHKMSMRLRARVSGWKPPRLIAFDWRKLGVMGRFTWIFTEQGQGCLVEERLDLKGPGLFILRGLGQAEALGHMVQRNLDGLKGRLENPGA